MNDVMVADTHFRYKTELNAVEIDLAYMYAMYASEVGNYWLVTRLVPCITRANAS